MEWTNSDYITLKIPHNNNIDVLLPFRKEQSKVYRIAYKLASYGLTEQQIRHDLKEKNIGDIDTWLINTATRKAMGQFKSDVESDKLNKTNTTGKRIFGGKRNFFRRLKGLITKEQYQENRIENFRSLGDSELKGNRKADFNVDSITIKPKRGIAVEIQLPKLHGEYERIYTGILEAIQTKSVPVTVELNENFIFLSVDKNLLSQKQKQKKIITGRYLGIDLNPNYIGVSVFNEYKKLIDTKLFNLKQLTGKNINANKLKHELREVAIAIGKLAQHYQLQYLFLEELNFKQGDKKNGKYYNRLTQNQFLYKEFERMLSKYGKVVKVNAAYSSTIGNILNHEYPDPIAASIEIARRGIESRVVKGSNAFYPKMLPKQVLVNRWKEEQVPEFDNWIELHNWLKLTGLRYRVPIPDIGMFSLFKSKSSMILVY